MSEKWAEMTPSQRDTLIHEKVMGRSLTCNEPIKVRSTANPDRSGGTAFTFYLLHCPICGWLGTSKEPPTTNAHPSSDPLPHYTTSMDAAWQVVEKFKQDGRGGYEFIQWQYHLGKLYNRPSYRDTLYDLNPEGVCIAGLRAVGVEIEPAAEGDI